MKFANGGVITSENKVYTQVVSGTHVVSWLQRPHLEETLRRLNKTRAEHLRTITLDYLFDARD